MGIGEVGVACRRTMAPVAEQLSHKRQVFAGHDGVAGCRVAQVVQAEPAEAGILAGRAPAGREAVGTPAFGMAREQEGIRVAGTGQRLTKIPCLLL